jgi:transposase-like protein
MTDSRKHFSPEQKIAILRRRLLEQVPISDLCDEYGIQPSVFYRWQQQLFENGAAAFGPQAKGATDSLTQEVNRLEEKLTRKNEVLSELMEEYVKLKKALGDA